jgi:c-di-GMP-binding flagellar brake protein YcgR
MLMPTSVVADRRKNLRVPVDSAARLKCLNPMLTTGPSIPAQVLDISRSGMRVCAERKLQPGSVVQIIVKDMFYVGTVRHTRPSGDGFEIGVRLTESIPSSRF